MGDLYLLSNSLFTGGKGIVHIDPLTGASTLLTAYSIGANSTFTYDAYRDRLVYADGRSTGGIVAVDAAGNRVDLAPTVATPRLVASRGDGILYFIPSVGPYTLRYLDASGVAHDVLDAAGAGPFQLSSGNFFEEMIYEPGTNSVLLVTGTSAGVPPPCVTSERTCAVKVPFTSAGTQVAGSLQFTDVDVSPAGEIVVGSGLAPGGVLVVVDTNENTNEPRLQLLDPVGMSMSVFASTGSATYPAAGMATGTYSSQRSQAVILDYLSSCLRGFGLGATGDGTRFAEKRERRWCGSHCPLQGPCASRSMTYRAASCDSWPKGRARPGRGFSCGTAGTIRTTSCRRVLISSASMRVESPSVGR